MKNFTFSIRIGLNEWLLIFAAFVAILMSCNNNISIKPIENTVSDSTINYNFKTIPDNDYYRTNSKGLYVADIELYLRIFQNLNPETQIKLGFKTDNFGVFVVEKDTLYPDDQTLLLLSDFKKFRKNGQFYTNSIGKQTLNFELEIGKTKKVAKAVFETK